MVLSHRGRREGPDTSSATKRNALCRSIRWRSIRPLRVVADLPDYIRAARLMMHRSPSERLDPGPVPIEDRGIDIVTVVFRDELDLLALQARSFDRSLDPAFSGRILVIVNDLRCDQIVARIRTGVLAHYGRWQSHVDIVPFHALAHRLDPANGWIIQQVLKLACAERITRPHYVVFDAKNHLVAPTSAALFIDEDGFALQSFEQDDKNLPDHDAAAAAYFGLDPADPERIRFATQTPFVMHTRTVRELVRHVEAREDASLSDFFCDRRLIAEFLLYGAFLESRAGGIPERYRDVTCQTITIWDNGCRTVEGSIRDAHDRTAFCFGVHRRTLAALKPTELATLTTFWRRLDLLGPSETLAGLATPAKGRQMASSRDLKRAVGFGLIASAIVALAPTLFFASLYADSVCFGVAALSLLLAAMRLRGGFANALLATASVAIIAALASGVIGAMAHDTRLEGEQALIAKGGPLGWTLQPGAHRVVKTVNGGTIYDVIYDIDASGQRITKSVEGQSGDIGKTVAFLGDSFTFGEGVAGADTLPQSFADMLGRRVRVMNYGVPAYSPAQVLRALQLGLYGDTLRNATNLFMLTASWHADRVACKDDWVTGAPRYVTRNGVLVSDGQCPPLPQPTGLVAALQDTAAYRALFAWRLPSVDDGDIANYIRIVAETVKVAREQYNAPLKLLYLRNAGYLRATSYTDGDIIGLLRASGADVLEMTIPHEGKAGVAIVGDGHPNGAGNRIRARMLIEALGREGSPLLDGIGHITIR